MNYLKMLKYGWICLDELKDRGLEIYTSPNFLFIEIVLPAIYIAKHDRRCMKFACKHFKRYADLPLI
jgi:hypothetical protein